MVLNPLKLQGVGTAFQRYCYPRGAVTGKFQSKQMMVAQFDSVKVVNGYRSGVL